MADEAETTTDSRALAPARPNRPTIIVQSPAAIFDSGKFEHLYRVATVMAKAGLMPESITHVKVKGTMGNDDILQGLAPDVVIARAFLIAAQADRWNMDPLALMNCSYLAHNKLAHEGKAVHAAINSTLGITLDYEFGAWDPKAMRVMIGVTAPQPELFGVVVSATLPGESKVRTIEGYVGAWKHDFSGKELPAWKSPGSWPRMLRYRGAREWCNAHSPEVTLGVLTDDDFAADSPQIQFIDQPPQERELSEAFGRQRAPAKITAADKPKPEPDKGKGAPDKPTGESKPAPTAEPAKATPASATDASKDSPAPKGSGPQGSNERSDDGAKAGTETSTGFIDPDTGEVYPTMEARLEAEKVKKAAAEKVVDFPGDRKAPAGEPSAPAADQTSKEPETTSAEPEVDLAEFNAFAQAVGETGTWADLKGCVSAFRRTPAMTAAPLELQRQAFLLALNHANEKGLVAPEGDVGWYRLWLAGINIDDPDDRALVRPAFRKLCRGTDYQGLPDDERNAVVDETNQAAGD